jgi:hypothetical protein
MKSPELVKLCQSLREILRAAVAATSDNAGSSDLARPLHFRG